MKLAILLLTTIAVSGVHAGNNERRQAVVVPSLAQARSIQVQFSGIEEHGLYAELPPVLVETAGASPKMEIWVEAYRGSGEESVRSIKLQSRTIRHKGAERITDVSGLDRLHGEPGVWTLRVMTGTGLDRRSLGQITFKVAHRLQADHVVRPGGRELLREPGF